MEKRQKRLRAHIKEFVLPPITDGLVLGRASPIGHVAVGRALSLLSTTAFEHIEIDDDVISDILIRKAILRKIPAAELKTFILMRSNRPWEPRKSFTWRWKSSCSWIKSWDKACRWTHCLFRSAST
jgi:hypothetical protein